MGAANGGMAGGAAWKEDASAGSVDCVDSRLPPPAPVAPGVVIALSGVCPCGRRTP